MDGPAPILTTAPRRPRPDLQQTIAWASMVAVLLAWEAFVRLDRISPLYLPGPVAILRSLIEQFRNGGLATDCAITLYRIFAGFAVALVLGVLLGVWMGTSRLVAGIALFDRIHHLLRDEVLAAMRAEAA